MSILPSIKAEDEKILERSMILARERVIGVDQAIGKRAADEEAHIDGHRSSR